MSFEQAAFFLIIYSRGIELIGDNLWWVITFLAKCFISRGPGHPPHSQLLSSLDSLMQPNRSQEKMPRNSTRCGDCKGSTSRKDVVTCESCRVRFHVQCQGIQAGDMSLLRELQLGYWCKKCNSDDTGYDFNIAYLRLRDAGRRPGPRQKAILREEIFMRAGGQEEERRFPGAIQQYNPRRQVQDLNANEILKKCGMLQSKKAVKVTANGSCLFNAVSIALAGSERLSNELRLRTSLEMYRHEHFYRDYYTDDPEWELLMPQHFWRCVLRLFPW